MKEKKLNEILPSVQKNLISDDGVPQWSEEEKKLIIKRLKKLDNLKGFSDFNSKDMVPSWFLLLKDDDLFEAFIHHPQCEHIIQYTESSLCKQTFQLSEDMSSSLRKHKEKREREYNEIIMLMQNIHEFSFLYERNAYKLKQLVNKGASFNFKNMYELTEYPNYLLGLVEQNLLKLNEHDLINQGSSVQKYNLDNMSFISQVIYQAEGHLNRKDENHQSVTDTIETIRAIEKLLDAGFSNKCYHYDLLTHKMTPPYALSIEEYSERFYPKFFKVMKKIEFVDHLKSSLSENALNYQKPKI